MVLNNILDAVVDICVLVLDALAWPATMVLSKSPTDISGEFAVAFGATLIIWLVTAVALSMALRQVAWWVRFSLFAMLSNAGGLKSMRRSTRFTYVVYQAISRVRAALGIRFYRVMPDQSDSFRQFPTLGHFSTGLARTMQTIAFMLYIPFRFVAGVLLTAKSWKFLLFTAGIAFWAVRRPDSAFWQPIGNFIQEFAKANTGTVLVAWIPGIAILVALLSSAKLRGRLNWRIRRFEDAHDTLDALSDQAQKSATALHRAIDESAHFLATTAIRDVTTALTAGRCLWNDCSGIERSPSSRHQARLPALHGGVTSWAAPGSAWEISVQQVHDHLNALTSAYQELCRSKRLESDIHNIAPLASRVVLFQLWMLRAETDDPWLRERRNVDPVVFEADTNNWLKNHGNIQKQFQALSEKDRPEAALVVNANLAIMELAQEFRSKLSEAMWFAEELESLVRAGQEIRFPSFFKRIREGASH
ncbi:hypothetical protein ART_2624 [Arthrobacter sp. PAMC 25486]|uniref:hypothetical protein n=1 Tax=Arthrobacter sp. PAMC 25486 TaxID=1494608 RepID=UPI000535C7F0|nr:hypothetical protein [Arthrobacter sp. PAMC 25486]AIY02223.1 hypothetical protein ART_2624 [Arthrobacter sp. PAMC 25486]